MMQVFAAGDTNVRLQPATLCTLNESIKGCAAGARHSLVLARASRWNLIHIICDANVILHVALVLGMPHGTEYLFMVTARRYRSSILMYSVINSRTEDKVTSYQVRIKQVIEILIKILVCQGLRYCLDTLPADQNASVRFTYESVLRCFPCRQSYVLLHRGTKLH